MLLFQEKIFIFQRLIVVPHKIGCRMEDELQTAQALPTLTTSPLPLIVTLASYEKVVQAKWQMTTKCSVKKMVDGVSGLLDVQVGLWVNWHKNWLWWEKVSFEVLTHKSAAYLQRLGLGLGGMRDKTFLSISVSAVCYVCLLYIQIKIRNEIL